MTSSADIRQSFTQYFKKQGHTHVASGPLQPAGDSTLMFANAGMVPFKDVFTGRETRDYKRATSSQKCIRISGKHNDLENVGVTARHHTFFEMLGNFSFGDYFKKEAIHFAWEVLTKTLKLDPNRIVITVFGGEKGYGGADEEAEKIWRDLTGFPKERIIHCGAKDNFWQMGDTGPCGPCSEIHYSLGTKTVDPSTFHDEPTPDGRGWFELWNLVFMQFDRQKDGSLPPLPIQSVDTGAGLERFAVVLQDKLSNYDTDLLAPLVALSSEISGKKYGGSQSDNDVSMRVIADHARTAAFLISEGVFPDKDKASYVLRRVMRRAIRHGHRLGIEEPFFFNVADRVVDLMGTAYPQLTENRAVIADVARQEEERFRRTLDRGLSLLTSNTSWTDVDGTKTLPGKVAFKLYDTFGFPLDLQAVIGEEQGFAIDQDGFDTELADAKERSRGSKLRDGISDVYFPIAEEFKGGIEFVGYDASSCESTILALIVDGERVDRVTGEVLDGTETDFITKALYPTLATVIAKRTPFYGEKGGQVGDTGNIRGPNGALTVQDTQIPIDGLIVHHGPVGGTLEVGDVITLKLIPETREATARNHSATHLLHWALREVVGPTVSQKGSFVSPSRLRFDYSSTRPLTTEEIRQVETKVNEAILANTETTTDELPIAEAKERGAIGMFGEKYGAEVRMLTVGPSIELCGGIHATRTGDIGLFTILSESGLAAGVRRIEAATGFNAIEKMRSIQGLLDETATALKSTRDGAAQKATRLVAEVRELNRDIQRLQKELVQGSGAKDLKADAKDIEGGKVLGILVPSMDGKGLREMADQLRDQLGPSIVVLGAPSKDGKKALLVCSVSKELTKTWRAGDIIKASAAIVGGGGGGRPDFAQAGGSDPSKLAEAVRHVYSMTGAE